MISVRMATVMVLLGASGAVAQPVRPGRTAAAPAATAAAPAPGVPAGPQQTTATFGDWTLRCVRPAGTGKLCEVAQIVQQDGKPVAQLAVGSASKAQKLQFTVLVAPNVSFAAAPALVPPGEDGAGQALNWRRCLPGGCIADAEIGDDLLAKMRGLDTAGAGDVRGCGRARRGVAGVADRAGAGAGRACKGRPGLACQSSADIDSEAVYEGRSGRGERSMKLHHSMMVVVMLSGVAAGAHAQGNPSADQIINSLRPSGGMMGGTRGIRPVAPNQPPAASEAAPVAAGTARTARPAAPRPAAPSASAEGAAPSVNLTVQFQTNSAELTPAAMTTLTALGQALSSNTLGTYRFRIEGHTDTVGSAEANKALSEKRAQAVVTFLVSRFHIDSSRLDPVGMGEDGLLVQTPPNTPELRNRRVQVINLGS